MPDARAPEADDASFAPSLLDLVLGGLLALVFFFVPVAIYFLITGAVPLFGGKVTQVAVLCAVALEAVAIGCAIYVAVLWRRHIGWRGFGLRPIGRRWIVGSALTGLGCVPLLVLVVYAVQSALGLPHVSPQAGAIAPEGASWWGLLLMLPLGGVAVPIAEELMFRGLLFRWLRRHLTFAPSAVLSAMIFGIVHGQLEVGIGAFVVGIVLAYAYERSGSLWPSIIIHAVQNSVSFTLMYFALV